MNGTQIAVHQKRLSLLVFLTRGTVYLFFFHLFRLTFKVHHSDTSHYCLKYSQKIFYSITTFPLILNSRVFSGSFRQTEMLKDKTAMVFTPQKKGTV